MISLTRSIGASMSAEALRINMTVSRLPISWKVPGRLPKRNHQNPRVVNARGFADVKRDAAVSGTLAPMSRHLSLRASLLAAIGAAGCSGPQGPGAGSSAVVEIPVTPATSTASAGPDEAPEPGTRPPVRSGHGWVQEKDGTAHRASIV